MDATFGKRQEIMQILKDVEVLSHALRNVIAI